LLPAARLHDNTYRARQLAGATNHRALVLNVPTVVAVEVRRAEQRNEDMSPPKL
jgi:hypothetical protein